MAGLCGTMAGKTTSILKEDVMMGMTIAVSRLSSPFNLASSLGPAGD